MEYMTRIFKALSDKNRLRVVAALMDYDELCACQLTELLQVTGATASRHMGVLVSAGLVGSRKDGRWVNYRLLKDNPDLSPVLEWIERRLKESPDADEDRSRMKAIPALEREEICRIQRGEACCPTENGDK